MHQALFDLDATALCALTRSGEVSCREVTLVTLERIHQVNPKVNALTLVLDEPALAMADAADQRLREGLAPGVLHGVPITIKINTDQLGTPTDDGMVNFATRLLKQDSPLVARLRDAGAVLVGRSNSPALGLAQNASNLLHGTTLNPWDARIMGGGSSGGAAVAVATGMCAVGQGNDLAGSLRWPAFCNGVVGLRPSPGLIPYYNSTYRHGMVFCEPLMTVHGPITRTVRDARLALQVMRGTDPRDPVTVPVALNGAHPAGPQRVALVTGERGPLGPVHPDIARAVRRAGEHLSAAGYVVEEVEPPLVPEARRVFAVLVGTELTRSLGPLLDRFIDPHLAAFVHTFEQLTADVTLDSYMAALRERDHIIRQWQLWMQAYPLVVLPPCTAPSLPRFPEGAGLGAAILQAYEALRSLQLSPLLGFPAVAVPVQLPGSPTGSRPLGVDVLAGRYADMACLAAAEAIEAREAPRSVCAVA